MKTFIRTTLLALLCLAGTATAQQLDTSFSCSVARDESGEAVTYADNAEIHIEGDRIKSFRWESALFRSTHGFDCSIDESDGLTAEVRDETQKITWRVALADANVARAQRGFESGRQTTCTIRLEREGDTLGMKPSCPALCGSRPNFSELSVNLKTGDCRYEE